MTETTPTSSIEHRRKRALWRANHRGTKELDWLIGRFAEDRVPAMTALDMDVFERFLAVPDPELHAWIMKPRMPTGSEFADLVHAVRTYHKMSTE